MSVKTIKASSSLVRDYWIIEEGILRVNLASPNLPSVLILSVDVACAVLGVFLFRALGTYFYLAAIIWSFIVFALFRLKTARVRARLGEVPLTELISTRATVTLFTWTQMSNFKIIGRTLEFRASGKRHNAQVDKADLLSVRELIESKTGRAVPRGFGLT